MMLRIAKFVVPIGVLLLAIADSHADKDCKQCETAWSECEQCPIAKAMDSLPKLLYKIGDEMTSSPVEAGRMARKTKHKIEFAVADRVFADESAAFNALVDTTEKFVSDFAQPQKCEVSGKTQVAGKSLCCDEAAAEVARLAKKAMDDVKVTYLVGEESVCCPDAAQALAKKSGEKVIPVVAGQKCGGCGTTTRLNIARAKYRAAMKALFAADQKNSERNTDNVSAKPTDDKVTNASAS